MSSQQAGGLQVLEQQVADHPVAGGGHVAGVLLEDQLGQGGGVQAIRNPAWDLLIYFTPRPDRKHTVSDRFKENIWRNSPVMVRQAWSGITRPGQEFTFTTVLFPHASTMTPKDLLEPPAGSGEPKRIEIAADRDDLTVVKVITEPRADRRFRYETWVMLNDTGKPAKAGPLESDGLVAVVGHHHDGKIRHRAVIGGRVLNYHKKDHSFQARILKAAPLQMPEDLRPPKDGE